MDLSNQKKNLNCRWRPPTASIVVAIVPTQLPQTTTTTPIPMAPTTMAPIPMAPTTMAPIPIAPTTMAVASTTTTTATTRQQQGLTIRQSPLRFPTTPTQVEISILAHLISFNVRVEAGVETER